MSVGGCTCQAPGLAPLYQIRRHYKNRACYSIIRTVGCRECTTDVVAHQHCYHHRVWSKAHVPNSPKPGFRCGIFPLHLWVSLRQHLPEKGKQAVLARKKRPWANNYGSCCCCLCYSYAVAGSETDHTCIAACCWLTAASHTL